MLGGTVIWIVGVRVGGGVKINTGRWVGRELAGEFVGGAITGPEGGVGDAVEDGVGGCVGGGVITNTGRLVGDLYTGLREGILVDGAAAGASVEV